MSSEAKFDLYGQATLWADQLRTVPSFTISDAEELKGHLLDIAEDLVSQGLSEAEAFAVAASRLGRPSELKDEFEEVNTPVIQLRRTILVLSGILVFFLFFYFLVSTTRLLVLALDHFSTNVVLNYRIVFSYVGFYLMLIVIATVIIYFSDLKKIERLEYKKIKPGHMLILYGSTLILALINNWLTNKIHGLSVRAYHAFYLQYTLFDYLNYLLPLISITCFIVLYKKFNRLKISDHEELPMKTTLLVLSGILVYFLLHFLLHSSARILFSALEYNLDDPELNNRRIWSFVMTYQLLFVLLTTAIYFLDKNLVKQLKNLNLKPAHTLWLLFATIFLAILDRLFLPIAARMIRNSGPEIDHKYWDVFTISDLSLPFILGACFLVLFSKYYRDNIKIGN